MRSVQINEALTYLQSTHQRALAEGDAEVFNILESAAYELKELKAVREFNEGAAAAAAT